MDEDEQLLEKMLDAHQEWLLSEDGQRAKKFCAKDFISTCKGESVWLSDFDFKGRNLAYADFNDSNASRVDFSGSCLNHATFRNAYAEYAILRGVSCISADFGGCTLDHAEIDGDTRLCWANLWLATGPFVIGYFGRHYAIAYADTVIIGCKIDTLDGWLENGRRTGRIYEYTEAEIDAYMNWIESAKKILKEMEHG